MGVPVSYDRLRESGWKKLEGTVEKKTAIRLGVDLSRRVSAKVFPLQEQEGPPRRRLL